MNCAGENGVTLEPEGKEEEGGGGKGEKEEGV